MSTQSKILKGFRDFLPEDMAIRNRVINTFRKVFESYGFSELQTPTLEYQEILLGKYGKEAEKLMYLFQDPGKREVGLKYDLTVPLARVCGQYPQLPLPFKRYQIQPIFRAEKPQMGRYREVYQCDIDTVGMTSPVTDAEILAVVSDSLKALGFEDFIIRINSRQVLFDLLKKVEITPELNLTVLQSVDKLDKKSPEEVREELFQKGLTTLQTDVLFKLLEEATMDENLESIFKLAKYMGVQNLEFDARLVRGLDYYTGSIFETVVREPKIGSITGGGRYDNLIKTLGGPDLPAVGTTFGLDRIVDVAKQLNLWPEISPTPTKILVTVFSEELLENSIKTASVLRENGINSESYPDGSAKLSKQLKYADKKSIPFAAIIGPEEVEKNVVTLKDLKTNSQEQVGLDDLIQKLT